MKRVGWALVALGLVDIAYMAYCIMHAQNYSSSLNIFAVIAGAFLINGHLGAARIVTWWSAFLFTGFTGGILACLVLMKPFDLWLAEFHLRPGSTLFGVLASAAATALLFWTYRELRSTEVLQARAAAGQTIAPPKLAFAAGALIVVGFVPLLFYMMHGETAAKALKLAEAKEGPGFKYNITSLSSEGEHGTASVTAYNASEIKSVDVNW